MEKKSLKKKSHRKKKIFPFATTWMLLDGIIKSYKSGKDKYYMILLTCGIKTTKQTHKTKWK